MVLAHTNNYNTMVTTPRFYLVFLHLNHNLYILKDTRYPLNAYKRSFKHDTTVSGALLKRCRASLSWFYV